MYTIQADKLQMLAEKLTDQHVNFCRFHDNLPKLTQQAIAESVVRRFLFCYDCLWKALRCYMKDNLKITDVPNRPKPLFRMAIENQVLTSSLDRWMKYAQARIEFRNYDEAEIVRFCEESVNLFIEDSINLYQLLNGKSCR